MTSKTKNINLKEFTSKNLGKLENSTSKGNVEYKNFSPEYLDEIVKIANSRFGENYCTKSSFLENLKKSNGMCTVAVDKESEEVLGYCLFFGENLKSAEKHFKIPVEELSAVSGGTSGPICHTKSLALKENCEKSGIGSELFKLTLDKAQDLGYKAAWCPAWVRNGFIPVGNILAKNDFTYYKTVGDLWKDDKNYKCVVCKGPCRCDAAVYYKKLN